MTDNRNGMALLDDPTRVTVSIPQAATILGIAKSNAYRICKSGFLFDGVPVLKIGGRRLVSIAHLRTALGLPLKENPQ